jgi:hypothetical protein
MPSPNQCEKCDHKFTSRFQQSLAIELAQHLVSSHGFGERSAIAEAERLTGWRVVLVGTPRKHRRGSTASGGHGQS